MFDSVYAAYVPVVKTMTSMSQIMEDTFPQFDEEKLCFNVLVINKPYMQYKQLSNALQTTQQQLNKLESLKEEEMKEMKNQILTIQQKVIKQLSEFSTEQFDEAQKECMNRNKRFEGAKLYICIEKNKKNISLDQKLKRMPKFGMRYQDPNEDTLIDDFKKEHGVD